MAEISDATTHLAVLELMIVKRPSAISDVVAKAHAKPTDSMSPKRCQKNEPPIFDLAIHELARIQDPKKNVVSTADRAKAIPVVELNITDPDEGK